MPEVVREMHAASGLTDEVLASTVTLRDAEEQVLAYVKEWVPEARKAPLCGNSIATDRGFLTRDMPSSTAGCTTGWSTCPPSRSWPAGGTRGPTSTPPRRAAGTGRSPTSASRRRAALLPVGVFVPPPGPTSEQAAAAAAAILGGDPTGASRTPAPSEQVPD
jgi:oligoribonuclease